MTSYYQGKFKPTNPKKYRGNPTNIIFRSGWELKFMKFCDTNKDILEWGSEEVIIPYKSPLDGRYHRYFPDFSVKIRTKDKKIEKRARNWIKFIESEQARIAQINESIKQARLARDQLNNE